MRKWLICLRARRQIWNGSRRWNRCHDPVAGNILIHAADPPRALANFSISGVSETFILTRSCFDSIIQSTLYISMTSFLREDRLRTAGLIAVRIGAVLSTGITLYAGRRNPSRLLIGLFVIWVLLPFVAMLWADIASRGWPVGLRATFYGVMLLITAGSVGIYGNAVLNPPEKGAFVFLTVPLASWVLIAGWMAAGYFGSRKRRDTMGV